VDVFAPPEVTSTLIYTGAGSASLTAASAAWFAVAAELEQFAADHAAITANLPWLGVSDAAMRAASSNIATWAQTTAAQAALIQTSAAQAAASFETVHATVTPPTVVFANRAQLMQLIATNILGQNTAAIAANEAQYAQMWAANIAAMTTYEATQQQATAPLSVFTAPTSVVNPAAQATNPAGVLQSYVTQLFKELTNPGALGNNSNAALGPNANVWNTVASAATIPVGVAALAVSQQSLDEQRKQNLLTTPAPTPAERPTIHNRRGALVSVSRGSAAKLGVLSVPAWTLAAQQTPTPAAVSPLMPQQDRIGMPVLPFMPVANAQPKDAKTDDRKQQANTPTLRLHPYGG
jgi:PPE-repeat protein